MYSGAGERKPGSRKEFRVEDEVRTWRPTWTLRYVSQVLVKPRESAGADTVLY